MCGGFDGWACRPIERPVLEPQVCPIHEEIDMERAVEGALTAPVRPQVSGWTDGASVGDASCSRHSITGAFGGTRPSAVAPRSSAESSDSVKTGLGRSSLALRVSAPANCSHSTSRATKVGSTSQCGHLPDFRSRQER